MKHKIPAAVAIAMMAGLVATAQAGDKDHDRRDRGSWSEHAKRGYERRDHGRNDHQRSDWRGQNRDWDGDRRGSRPSHGHDNDRWDNRWDNRDHGYRYSHYDRNPYYRSHDRYRAGYYYQPHGYRHYSWRRGDRLPVAYYAPRYVVYDYGSYHLHRPPYGYHWVRVDNDVVLAAITTGIVLQVVDQIFY